jgi:phosphatidylserine/phosphatidylglycerophosphate/cardiolipin synthase-like enzyme
MRPGSVFSFPNRGKKQQVAIRKRVLNTIKSTWGGRRYSSGAARPSNGRIRIATWTFDDWAIARALYWAHKRGVSVQVLAAKRPNQKHRPWRWLRKRLPHTQYKRGHPETANRWSFARTCRGSCRGRGGTAHSKYFLFSNVGTSHVRTITVQSSMNLTRMGYKGQWNHATTTWRRGVHKAFRHIFAESRRDRPVSKTYRRFGNGKVQSSFFPRPGTTANYDPVMRALRNNVQCTGAAAGGDRRHRTQIRIIQYALYNTRGVWIAKRLKRLWNAGCNVKVIYGVTSRPVLAILRSRAGRGRVPMKQSVIRNAYGEIVKYNHSKWMTITGRWGRSRRAHMVFSGSSNWGNLAFSSDEQMQQISSYGHTRQHLAAFTKTWRQRSSRRPGAGRVYSFGRMLPGAVLTPEQIPEEPVFGEGIYKYLPED